MNQPTLFILVLLFLATVIVLTLTSINTHDIQNLKANSFTGTVSTNLNLQGNSIQDVKSIQTKSVVVKSQTDPAALTPSTALQANETLFFSSGLGDLEQWDGTQTVTYQVAGTSNHYISGPSSATIGNLLTFSSSDGKTVIDGGLAQSSVQATISQAEPIAPAGQRDTWTLSGSNSEGGSLHLVPWLDILLTDGTTGGLYSSDGGATFNPCVYDVTPTDWTVFGSSNNVVVAFSYTGDYYTSTDGINYTKQGNLPGVMPNQFSMTYFNGLIIMSDFNTPGQAVLTSPDGITWTQHSFTPIIDTFHSNSTLAIGVNNTSPYAFYSTDGINWNNTPSTLTEGSRSIAWSDTLQIWTYLGFTTGKVYTSTDGIHWTAQTTVGASATTDALIWVSKYDRFYAGTLDPSFNWGLWSSPDPRTVDFANVTLNGAGKPDGTHQDSPMVYMESRDRFVMSFYTGIPACTYSTPRYNALVPLSDLYLSNGGNQVHSFLMKYAQPNTVTVSNTATQTTILSTAGVGFLRIPANSLQIGSSFAIKVGGSLSSVAGSDTCLIQFKLGSVTIAQCTLTPSTGTTPFFLNAEIQFLTIGSSGTCNSICGIGAGTYNLMTGTTINTTINQTLAATVTWSVADPSNTYTSNVFTFVRES